MRLKHIHTLYFSPTGGTGRIARYIADILAERLGLEQTVHDLTPPQARREPYRFAPDELAVIASPVYAGRLPNKVMPDLKAQLLGEGTPALPLCVYGDRSPDEALRELVLLLEDNGFRPAGAAAFPCRHAFSDKVGTGRPDGADLTRMADFAQRAADKLAGEELSPLDIDRSPIGLYYVPLKEDGTPARFLKALPVTDPRRCTRCGLCVRACPMGSIDPETCEAQGLCIKCQACVRRCPNGAKAFRDADFLSHVAMLERTCTRPTEGEIIL